MSSSPFTTTVPDIIPPTLTAPTATATGSTSATGSVSTNKPSGTLYTLAMTDIGAREKGITLVNSTAVLVLTYTLGGLTASGMSGALIDWSPTVGFPLVLIAVAAIGLVALLRTRRGGRF